MMTILSRLSKTLTPAGSRGRDIRWGTKCGSVVTHRLEMDVSGFRSDHELLGSLPLH